MSYEVEKLRFAETFEPEDSRVGNRLATALTILEAGGVKPTITYGPKMVWDWPTSRDRVDTSRSNKTVEWEPWVTDKMFSDAYALASTILSERGTFHVNAAYRAKQERISAEWAANPANPKNAGPTERELNEGWGV